MISPLADATPFRIPKTAELVAARIRGQIVRRELQENDALPSESNLMEEFSISRPTLREAFRILESEGLIAIRRGARGGARVQSPSTEMAANYAGLVLQHRGATLEDVLDARAAIEPHAAAMVAMASTRKSSARTLRSFEAKTSADLDQETYARSFFDFNRLLVSLTGNETLTLITAMIEMISETATYRLELNRQPEPKGLRETVTRVRSKLADLIEAGDADAAEAVWRAHLVAAGKQIAGDTRSRVVDVLS